jgi:hypothetical protein
MIGKSGEEMTMIKRSVFALAVVALTLPTTTFAQVDATLILRSGERVSGQLWDHARVGFTIKVNGQDRTIPTADVAVVDFTGKPMTDADWAKVPEGKHVLWMHGDHFVIGQFTDIGGTNPLYLSWKDDDGERNYSSRETARIVLARTDKAVAATTGKQDAAPATASGLGGGIVVQGKEAWTSTGIAVRRGEWVTLNATGEIRLTTDAADVAGAAGSAANRTAANAPVPAASIGTLIGRVGNSRPFVIGNQTRVQMPANGILFLGINDDHHADNSGEFRVEVERSRVRR